MHAKLINALAITLAATATTALADETPTSSQAEQPGVSQPGDVSPPVAQAMVDDVQLGTAVGTDGRIPAESRTDDFLPGEDIHLTMDVSDAPKGSTVKVVWVGPAEERIAEQKHSVADGLSTLRFVRDGTSTWIPGDYRAEVWVGDEKVNDENFSIVSARRASK